MTTLTEPTLATTDVRGNSWRPSWHGVALVARIELMRRRPSPRGWIFYGLVLLGILGLGMLSALQASEGLNSFPLETVLILVLGAGMLIAPSLSATSINGDSGEGVLAPLQMTRLTAGDLAFGKLLASWAVAVAALITTTPVLLYAFADSGWHASELLGVLGAILLVVLTATAVGLAWSSLAARAVASVTLAHLTTAGLALGTLIVFLFTTPLVAEDVTVTYTVHDTSNVTDEQWNDPTFDYAALPCVTDTQVEQIYHTEKTAWMLLINPVVMIAEASPMIDPETFEADGRAAPGAFAQIHQAVGDARMEPMVPTDYDECAAMPAEETSPWYERQLAAARLPQAPWLGLGVQGLLLVGSMAIVVRRLRVPYKTLRAGSRVA